MAGSVVLDLVSIAVVPGEVAVTTVRIRNTGSVVDQFAVSLVGQPAAWTTVVPAAISLFPGSEGTVSLHVAPPRAPGIGLGPVPFGVRVVATEDPDLTVVEEGQVDLLPFVDVTAKLTPRTSESRRNARHEVVLDNRGNASVEVEVEATDPDEHLAFEVRPRMTTLEGGHTARVVVNVAARNGFARGADKHRPFQVMATTGPERTIVLDGAMVQKQSLPKFLVPLVAVVIAVGVMAMVLPGLLKGKDDTDLQTAAPTTTTTLAPTTTEAPIVDGPATADEAAAAAEAERLANGRDPDGPGPAPAPDGGTSAAGTGGTTEATTTTVARFRGADFVGEWVAVEATAEPAAFRITPSPSQNVFRLDLETASTTPFEDANDGTLVFTTTTPEERHSMAIDRQGRLVDTITGEKGSRSLVYVRRDG